MLSLLLLNLLIPAQDAPPGMVLVEGSRKVVIGTPLEELEELIRGDELLAPALAAEYTKKRKVEVADFYMMPTEVTNEQYYVFVRSTGHRPPIHWGEEATNAAEEAHRAELLALPPDERDGFPTFDRADWWDENWSNHEWEIPSGIETVPVVWVDYQDAEAYARWAGLRLPTEFEIQAAGRGEKDQNYPWGEEWVQENAVASTGLRRPITDPKAVGSAAGGATGHGVHDLIGNVWEWTASPFEPYDGYESFEVKVGSKKSPRTVTARADWNSDRRVVMGGCCSSSSLATRLSTRRGTDRFQRTDSMGFRCAADLSIGTTAGQIAYDALGVAGRRGSDFDLSKSIGMDQWYTGPKGSDVAGYEVITGYDYLVFVPVAELDFSNLNSLDRVSIKEEPVTVGILTSTLNIVEPALPAGSYTLAYRGSGKFVEDEEPEEEGEAKTSRVGQETSLEELIDPKVANLIVYDRTGTPILGFPVEGTEIDKPNSKFPNGTIEYVAYEAPRNADPADPRLDTLTLVPSVPTTSSRKSFQFELKLRTKQGHMDANWRK
jgi:formylglycine-generating enzyme required for sulfatase activity